MPRQSPTIRADFLCGLSGKAPVPSLCKEFCAERVSIRPQPAAEHVQELHVPHKASLKNASHRPCFGQLSDSSGSYFHFGFFLPLPVISFLYCIVKRTQQTQGVCSRRSNPPQICLILPAKGFYHCGRVGSRINGIACDKHGCSEFAADFCGFGVHTSVNFNFNIR